MPVVNRAVAPASRNIDIGGYGSRVALRLPGTTAMDSNVKQPGTPPHSRRMFRAEFGPYVPPFSKRGRRECRAPDAPDSRVCRDSGCKRTRVVRSHRNRPAFPAQWFYGLFRALPGDRACLSPSPAALAADLTPASRRQDHTTSPSASGALVFGAIRVHRIPPHVRDDRETPLSSGGTAGSRR
jgi:hypothetical protein